MFEDTVIEGMNKDAPSAHPPTPPPPPSAPPPSPPPPPPSAPAPSPRPPPPSTPAPSPPPPPRKETPPKLRTPQEPPQSPQRVVPEKESSSLDSEFLYYSGLIKEVAATMTRSADKAMVYPWINKLFGPEYAGPLFREKRNRYLCALSLTMMNDELTGVFSSPPAEGALPHWSFLDVDEIPPAAWELDTMWEETLEGTGGTGLTPEDVPCSFHDNETDFCPDVGVVTSKMLDDEFAFYLYLCRPYAAMMPSADEKTKVATWLQALQMISKNACPTMKGMRNDYIQALLGCTFDLRTAGPFVDYPPATRLYPLMDAARIAKDFHPSITDPGSREAEDFMRTQPIPEEGAFCYIAVTGDVHDTSVPGLLKQRDRPKTPPRTSLPLTLNNYTTLNYQGTSSPNRSAARPQYEVEELYKKDNN